MPATKRKTAYYLDWSEFAKFMAERGHPLDPCADTVTAAANPPGWPSRWPPCGLNRGACG